MSAQARPSRQSGPSLATATKARKRPVLDEEDEDDGAAANGEIDLDALEGLSDDDAEEEDEEDEEEDEDDEDEDGEDFPELDIGSDEDGEEFPQLDIGSDEEEAAEDEEADGKSADEAATAEDGADADTESEEDEELDDEDSMSESGYNSSDIEAMYDSPASPGSSSTTLLGEERLSKLIAKHTVKPDDDIGAEGQISGAKLGEGRLRPSKLVKGGFTREYEDVEAGYGSESSTEDVSHLNRAFAYIRADAQNPNTIGNVPIEWYEDLPHIGYDVSGRKIFRPAKGDELDKFLSNVEDPSAWTSVEDKLLQQQVQLTDQELDIIRRLEKAENPDAGFDPYQENDRVVYQRGADDAVERTARAKAPLRSVQVGAQEGDEDCQGDPGGPHCAEQAVSREATILPDMVRGRQARRARHVHACATASAAEDGRIVQPAGGVPPDRGGEERVGGDGQGGSQDRLLAAEVRRSATCARIQEPRAGEV